MLYTLSYVHKDVVNTFRGCTLDFTHRVYINALNQNVQNISITLDKGDKAWFTQKDISRVLNTLNKRGMHGMRCLT